MKINIPQCPTFPEEKKMRPPASLIRRLLLLALLPLVVVGVPIASGQRPSSLPRPLPASGNPVSRGRALLVGIDKYQTPGVTPTAGGEADASAMSRLVQEQGWFKSDEIRTLIGPAATAQRIEEEFLHWLIEGSRPGDQILFFYSGHGTQILDTDGDERTSDASDDRDEAIAPYDVYQANGRLHNVIVDDQFNQWIERLSGRSVVLIFDSCHSGTVSRSPGGQKPTARSLGPRYLPSAEQWIPSTRTRSMGDSAAYQVQDGPATRNLKLVVDQKRLTPNSLVTLISAAGSHQLAYPMLTPARTIRGALSHFLEEGLRQRLTVHQLFDYVREKIKRAQTERRLHGSQVPHLEISSPSMIANQPLFRSRVPGEPTESVAMLGAGMSNPHSSIRISAEVGKVDDGRFRGPSNRFCVGDEIGYRVRTDTPGYLYLVVFSQNDHASLIYPDQGDPTSIDQELDLLDQFVVSEPVGKDVVLALITTKKLDLTGLQGRTLNWEQMQSRLKDLAIEVGPLTRGVTNRKTPHRLTTADWQVTRIESEARRCQ